MLRELLEQMTERDEALGQALYALLKATSESFAEAKAERDSWERQCRNAEHGLAEAKATIRKLRASSSRRWARIEHLHKELAEAEVEIEKLCHPLSQEDDRFRHIRARLAERRKYWEKRCLKAEDSLAQLEILSADAEIGRLVGGMAENTRLTRFYTGYAVEAQQRFSTVWVSVPEEFRPTGRVLLGARYADPAEALQAIQEVGDDPR